MPIWSPAFFGSAGSSGYTIENSVWFDGSADYLSWTPSGAGDNADKATISMWIKRVDGGSSMMFHAGADLNNRNNFLFNGSQLHSYQVDSSVVDTSRVSSNLFRDPTAWVHVVQRWDSTQDTAGDRARIYVNGTEVTSYGTNTTGTQNRDTHIAQAVQHYIGAYTGPTIDLNCYVAEFIMLDGISAGPDSFGEFDDNGVWVPIDPSGLTFGTNGAWLDFAIAPGTGAGSGNDVSGNNNDFTETSMTAAQQVTDSPTDDADNDVGNYCTWNPLSSSPNNTFSEGNLRCAMPSSGSTQTVRGSVVIQSGKWHWEATLNSGSGSWIGVLQGTNSATNINYSGDTLPAAVGVCMTYSDDGKIYNDNGGGGGAGGVSSTAPATYSAGDRITVELNADDNEIEFFKDGSSQVTITSGLAPPYIPTLFRGSNPNVTINFGQTTFTDTPSSGFKALNTANLAAPTVTKPSDYFKTVLYTGNGTAIGSGGKAVTGVGFQPDFVWIKNRDATDSHMLFDASRGVTKYISSDTTAASATDTESLSTFDSDGFTVGNNVAVNTNTEDYVAFCLKAGGAGSSNTTGSINTTKTSVATHGGFSISTYTGTGANATVGHGLSSEPQMIITKNLTDTDAWAVYHSSNTSAPETEYLVLNTNAATADLATYWNDTAPTSSVFSIGSVTNTNGSSDSMVAYCFARTPGLIGIGSYIGNANTDGPYVVVDDGASGFKPAILITKGASSAGSWIINDASRSPFNVVNDHLLADSNAAEATSTSNNYDFTANGFKVRSSNGDCNSSGNTIIYLAFAENPFGGSGVAQARAR